MTKHDGIFSQRIVVADFYLEKPAPGLDVCYSEFRGREIKRVPVIRIFGSNAIGQKTCMHVHGVYPYFYIPYEEKSFESVNKAIYQIAMNLDKAINISLGQSNSKTQHVFKIQLVKGIPFYGYHRSEHQYLKIYMLNPRFIRRAANLLQNAAILDKQFLPHESHVPYILQFMIDYNLYGMSFLHVPLEIVKFRVTDEQEIIPFKGISPSQILDCKLVKKLSVSCLEVDVTASFILNRFQLITNTNAMHSNPGIESIWHDEKLRREKMLASLHADNENDQLEQIPALEIPMADERNEIHLTKTELYYHSVLKNKVLEAKNSLSHSGTSSEQTLSGNSLLENESVEILKNIGNNISKSKRKFDLSKLLQNAVYPQECSLADNLLNASYIEDHLSLKNSFGNNHLTQMNDTNVNTPATTTAITMEVNETLMDNTTIDEQLILNLSQKPHVPLNHTMREEDLQLLNVLQELEENDHHDDDGKIDLDSTLAPLTQCNPYELSPKSSLLSKEILNATLTTSAEVTDGIKQNELAEECDDEGNLHDFSIALENLDDILNKLTQSKVVDEWKTDHIAQFDGTDDLNGASIKNKISPRTPKRSAGHSAIASPSKTSPRRSPRRSPRTPKTIHKFAALPLLVTNRSSVKSISVAKELNDIGTSEFGKSNDNVGLIRKLYVDKPASTSLINKSNVKQITEEANILSRRTCRRRRNSDLDKTHITCSLTAVRRSQRLQSNKLKFCNTNSDCMKGKNENIKPNEVNLKATVKDSENENNPSTSKRPLSTYDSDSVNVESDFVNLKASVVKLSKLIHLNRLQKRRKTTKSTTSFKTPQRHEKFDEIETNTPKSKASINDNCGNNSPLISEEISSHPITSNHVSNEEEEDSDIESFYEESAIFDSPSVFSNDSNSPFVESKLPSPTHSDAPVMAVITPIEAPPSHADALDYCKRMQLPEHKFPQPFYSNPDDVHKAKEIGCISLRIPGNKLRDLEECEHILGAKNIQGLRQWRLKKFQQITASNSHPQSRKTQMIREFFANNNSVVITPVEQPPTLSEAKLWLKARELLRNSNTEDNVKQVLTSEVDSPIKIRRQKLTLMATPNLEESDDTSDYSLTMTPMTPQTDNKSGNECMKTKALLQPQETPTSSQIKQKLSKSGHKFDRKRIDKRLLKRVCLNTKMQTVLEDDNSKGTTSTGNDSDTNSECSTDLSSINSQAVMKELERSSFLRQLKDSGRNSSLSNSILDSTFGYKVALENLQQAKSDIEFTYLTIMCLEVFVSTRGNLLPNPEIDEINCLFYAIENSIPPAVDTTTPDSGNQLPSHCCGYIIVKDGCFTDQGSKYGLFGINSDVEVTIVNKEVEAFDALICICSKWDPDIYAGYEIEMSSWGYVIDRAKYLCFNIAPLLSRVPTQKVRDTVDEDRDDQLTDLDVEMKLCGRILLDVWRLMRSEIALTSYTFENVIYHVLHKRCPWHNHETLTAWYGSPSTKWIVLEYYLERVRGLLAILEQLDLIGRTSEMAKLIGIQFYEVLSRGSQFRVESMMLRIAKPKNLVPVSPSVQQRANMRAPEFLPLILEPSSRFFPDPMIVLDFQSLYPSVIIAYNYCFSTCLGRVEHLGQSTPFEFGASQLRVSRKLLIKLLELDLVTISPCGVVFVKSSVREGILPRLLKEILHTRQMVKQSMKLHKTNSALQRILHSRQLALKLMANVTYGYTAANFSGRMPAVEVGDSVVAKSHECLDRAIRFVEENSKWNVKVVYGDTDSMFVLVPGRRREEAFAIGEEIAEAVTKNNPYPVKLKLEKIYQPCILQTKKRYVGYMYETVDQKDPVYDAKGIETVRRDGCPLVAKMLEKVLRLLFETSDVSKIKSYVNKQFTKLLCGQTNLQDLIFAKEFRGLHGYMPNACVPALELTRKWKQIDPRRIPRRGERVPFVIINGPPGVPLIRLVRHPHEVIQSKGLHINAIYYITKAIIPPLNRCLLLIGADANEWFANLPRKILLPATMSTSIQCNEAIASFQGNSKMNSTKKSTISQFFSSTNCVLECGRQAQRSICSTCCNDELRAVVMLQMKISKIESAYVTTQQICQTCCGRVGNLRCDSLDCPVFYVLENKRRDLQTFVHLNQLVNEYF